MVFPIFVCVSSQLQKSKTPQAHHDWFLINCGKVVNLRVPGKGPVLKKKIPKMLFVTISISKQSLMTT